VADVEEMEEDKEVVEASVEEVVAVAVE